MENSGKEAQQEFLEFIQGIEGIKFYKFVNTTDYSIVGILKRKLLDKLSIGSTDIQQKAQWMLKFLQEFDVKGEYLLLIGSFYWPQPLSLVFLDADYKWLVPLIQTQTRTFKFEFIHPNNQFRLTFTLQEGFIEAQQRTQA